MESKYLETVLRVAECMNFSRAAEEIPCAQSVVSRHVRAVEEELGVTIFQRSQKSNVVKLTRDGARILPLIRKVTEDIAALTETTSALAAAHKTEYTIGIYLGVIGLYAQNRLLQDMYVQFPNIMVRFVALTVPELREYIHQRKVDALLVYEVYWREEPGIPTFAEESGVLWETLRRQDPCIAMRPENPLSKQSSVAMEQLRDECFVVNYDISRYGILPGYKMHDGFLRSCTDAGFVPRVIPMDNNDCANLRNSAVMQYGYMYPTFLCPCLRDNNPVQYVPIKDPIYYANYYFIWFRNGKTAISRQMLDYFRKEFA